MRPYADLTDDELTAEIKQYRDARKEALFGGGVGVIAGEGRRIEYTKTSVGGLDQELRLLYYEARARGLPIGGTGGAIAVEIG